MSPQPPKAKTNKRRHLARRCAVQALYQWHHTCHSADEIIKQFIEDDLLKHTDANYFNALVTGTIDQQVALDELLTPLLDRPITRLNPVELAVLRVAAYELRDCPQIPYRVVLNEALDVTKDLGADQGHKYVNAILDKLAPTLRSAEQ